MITADLESWQKVVPTIFREDLLKIPMFRQQLEEQLKLLDDLPLDQGGDASRLVDLQRYLDSIFDKHQIQMPPAEPVTNDRSPERTKSPFKIAGKALRKTFSFDDDEKSSDPFSTTTEAFSRAETLRKLLRENSTQLRRLESFFKPDNESTWNPPNPEMAPSSNPFLKDNTTKNSLLNSLPKSGMSQVLLDSFVEAVDKSSTELFGAYADPNRLQNWTEWQKKLTKNFNSWNRGFERVSRTTVANNPVSFSTNGIEIGTRLTPSEPVVGGIVIAAIVLGGLLFLKYSRQAETEMDPVLPTVAIADVNKISCPRTLVSVCNQLMLNLFGRKSRFWNHRTMIDRLRRDMSVSRKDLDRLSDAYARARYDESRPAPAEIFADARRTLGMVQKEATGQTNQ